MTCYVCGSQMPEEARFCPVCGRFYPESSAPVGVSEAPKVPPVEIPDVMEGLTEPLPDCGGIPVPPMEFLPEEQPKKKKRRNVVIPVIIMAALMTVGSICFFLLPSPTTHTPEPTEPFSETAPQATAPASKPERPGQNDPSLRSEDFTPTDPACFLMTEEGLSFLPHKYQGGAVLVIPDQVDGVEVTAIAPNGFAGLEGVTTLVLPDTLETIGDYAFAGCVSLRGVWLPDAMREIGEGAFQGCLGLESVAVQSRMEVIGKNAFTGCARLFYFFYDGTYEDWLELYNEYVTPYTSVTCLDGDYYHGVKMP